MSRIIFYICLTILILFMMVSNHEHKSFQYKICVDTSQSAFMSCMKTKPTADNLTEMCQQISVQVFNTCKEIEE